MIGQELIRRPLIVPYCIAPTPTAVTNSSVIIVLFVQRVTFPEWFLMLRFSITDLRTSVDPLPQGRL